MAFKGKRNGSVSELKFSSTQGSKWPLFIGNTSLHAFGFLYPKQAKRSTKGSLWNAFEEFSTDWECTRLTPMKLLFYRTKMVHCRQFYLAFPNRKLSIHTLSFTPSLHHDLLYQKILKPQHTASRSFTAQHKYVIDKTALPGGRWQVTGSKLAL